MGRDDEIRRVLHLYAHGLDTRDFALAASIFAPGCEVHGTFASGPVEEYWPKIQVRVEEYGRTMHLVGNVLVHGKAEEHPVAVDSYCVAYHLEPLEGEAPWVIAVRYEDRMSETADGWKVTERRVHKFWERNSL